MKTELAYDKFQIKINNNSETGKISVDRGRFVIIYNEEQNRFFENTFDKKKEDDIRYAQKLLVYDYVIPPSVSREDYQAFPLPKNYFEFSSATAIADKGDCKNKKITLFEIKDDDSGEILQDNNNSPSFEAREAPFHIASDTVKVYKEDFDYSQLQLSYYRYPIQIALIDDENPESDFDPELNPEFDDKIVDRIISLASAAFELNNESQKSMADRARAQNKI